MKWRIVLIESPALGKGMQVEMIGRNSKLPTSAKLREELRPGEALGDEAEVLLRQGRFGLDAMVNRSADTWHGRFRKAITFGGYPKSAGEVASCDEMPMRGGAPFDGVFPLEVDEITVRDRVERAFMCLNCGSIVGLSLRATSKEGDCPKCGGAFVKRGDDLAESPGFRMREYSEKTQPLISYCTDRVLLGPIESRKSPQAMFQPVKAILEDV